MNILEVNTYNGEKPEPPVSHSTKSMFAKKIILGG